MPLRRVPRIAWVAALVVYAVTLAIATHTPGVKVPTTFEYTDKLIHMSAFAGLTVVAWFAIPVRHAWRATLALAAYAAIDEWTQQFVGRNTDVLDWAADVLGIGLAIGALVLLRRRQRSSTSRSSPSSPS